MEPNSPTIHEFAKRLDRGRNGGLTPPLPPNRTGDFPHPAFQSVDSFQSLARRPQVEAQEINPNYAEKAQIFCLLRFLLRGFPASD